MFNCDQSKGSLYLAVNVEADFVHKAVKALPVEQRLRFAKAGVYCVELRTPRHVPQNRNVQLFALLLGNIGFMQRKVVHQQS